MNLEVKKHSSDARLPERKSALAAGYDLFAATAMTIEPGKQGIVSTEVSIEVPPGTYGRIAPRSGLAVKHAINILGGVIDADYRGKVMVIMINHSHDVFQVNVGDRIAQLILEVIVTPPVKEVQEHTPTERGAKGFGSTGV